MQTVLTPEHKTGIFIQELKNRFLCEVEIDGESTVCYVPSSCHLSNFLDLKGKSVLLAPTQSKNARTQFALFAIPYKKNYILLNTSMANRAVADSIKGRRFSFLGRRGTIYTEHYVGGYKSDIYIQDTNTIIEVKSVLSTEKCALYPTVFSERALKQLEKLRDLLSLGYRVHYSVISLNPYVSSIYFVSDAQFTPLLKSCIDLGMTISAFSCRIDDNRVHIDKRLQSILP